MRENDAERAGWLLGLGLAAALVGCMVVGLIVRRWSRKER